MERYEEVMDALETLGRSKIFCKHGFESGTVSADACIKSHGKYNQEGNLLLGEENSHDPQWCEEPDITREELFEPDSPSQAVLDALEEQGLKMPEWQPHGDDCRCGQCIGKPRYGPSAREAYEAWHDAHGKPSPTGTDAETLAKAIERLAFLERKRGAGVTQTVIAAEEALAGLVVLVERLQTGLANAVTAREDAEEDARRAEALVEQARKSCNICGKLWPEHYPTCSYQLNYKNLKSAQAFITQLQEELEDANHALEDERNLHELQKNVVRRLRRLLVEHHALGVLQNVKVGDECPICKENV